MYKIIEVELTEDLKEHGFSRIAIEASTIVVMYNGSCIRCDIENSWNKTMQGFKKYAKDLIPKKEILQALISFISEKWLEILEKRSQQAEEQWEQQQRERQERQRQQQQKKEQNESDNYDGKVVRHKKQVCLPPNTNPVEYAIEIIKRNVKGEDHNIRIIEYAGLSKDTFDPISVAILAPTSEGKTHLVMRTISDVFPKKDVMLIGSMTPKVLIRQYGELVDENNVDLQPRIDELKYRIRIAKELQKETIRETTVRIKKEQHGLRDVDRTGRPVIEAAFDTTVEELEHELDKLLQTSRSIIDLHGKILIFLEPPHPEVWKILKSILSHDHWEIPHPYVDTEIKVRNIVTRGWPVCIFCSARDESKWDIWPEIQNRFLVISPNMSEEKYEQANILTIQKKGLPDFVQQKVIVSRQEKQNARECISILGNRFKELCTLPTELGPDENPKNPVCIPYQAYLGASLPHSKGVEMRGAKHLASLLHVIAIAKSRFLLDTTGGVAGAEIGSFDVIARPEDLIEALLIKDLVSGTYAGIPIHKIAFFENTFYRRFELERDILKESKDGTKKESVVGLYTSEICDYHKDITRKGMDPANLQHQYLEELVANNLIGKTQSEIDGRRQIYYPLIEPQNRFDGSSNGGNENAKIKKLVNETVFTNISDILTLDLSRDYKEIPKDWLIMHILALANYRMDFGQARGFFADFLNNCEEFKLLETDGFFNGNTTPKRLKINEFISKYESAQSIPIQYIFKPHFKNFHSRIFGKMKEIDTHEFAGYRIFMTGDSFMNLSIFGFELGIEEGTL